MRFPGGRERGIIHRLRYNEYICAKTDECYITQTSSYTDGIVCSYPTSKGRKSRWTTVKVFTLANSYSTRYATTRIPTYKFCSSQYGYGYISPRDAVRMYEERNGYTRVLYPISGGYKFAWIKTSDAKKYLQSSRNNSTNDNPNNNSNNNISSNNGISYADYKGVRYDNIGLSIQRVQALNKAKNMVTIRWKAPVTFPTWCSKNGTYNYVTATDNTKSNYFIKGKTYTGVPYSLKNHSWDDTIWKNKLSSLTTAKMTGTYYSHKKSTTANGIDCSYFVYSAFKSAVPSYPLEYQTTGTMLNSRY